MNYQHLLHKTSGAISSDGTPIVIVVGSKFAIDFYRWASFSLKFRGPMEIYLPCGSLCQILPEDCDPKYVLGKHLIVWLESLSRPEIEADLMVSAKRVDVISSD